MEESYSNSIVAIRYRVTPNCMMEHHNMPICSFYANKRFHVVSTSVATADLQPALQVR